MGEHFAYFEFLEILDLLVLEFSEILENFRC